MQLKQQRHDEPSIQTKENVLIKTELVSVFCLCLLISTFHHVYSLVCIHHEDLCSIFLCSRFQSWWENTMLSYKCLRI